MQQCVSPPYISFIVGLHMLLLLHALIPCSCLAACFTLILHTRTLHTLPQQGLNKDTTHLSL